jgi:pimeloyl-ACP methyl ester carboxylesterase
MNLHIEGQARSVVAGGVETRYLEAGQGPCEMVLVHGGARSGLLLPSALAWEANLAALARHGRVVAPDGPGQGESAAPAAAAPGIEDLVVHLEAFADAVAMRRPHLIGHDEGALAALLLALRRPERVASVTLVGSCAAPSGDAVPNLALVGAPEPVLSGLSQAWVLEHSSYSHHHVTQGNYLREAVRRAGTVTPEVAAQRGAALRSGLARAKSEVFARLRDEGLAVPGLLLWGAQDPLVPLDNALALYRLLLPRQRTAQLRVINRAGNLPFREQPEAFDRLLSSFLLAQ